MSQSQDERNSSDWLSCVSKKTGMPRLILSLILLSCAVMMIWLCLTAAVTSPDHRIKQESKVWLQAQTVQYPSGLLHICSLISHWIQRCLISFIKKFSVKGTWKKLMQNWNAFFFLYFLQKLSINGDLEYLREQEAMGVRLLFPQEKLDADPLPIKIKVQRL